ncbi:MAG: hypothetical protein J0I31_11565 [Rhizobiales bacterium]|nr:hypothetical protein [Hyphomicrobiales bacterium]
MTRLIITPNEEIIWTAIRRYQSIGFLKSNLPQHHREPERSKDNINKLAKQISFSIDQAINYFRAADAVPLQTKPLLIYYGICAFATADILWRGDGSDALDNREAKFRSHGLKFSIKGDRTLSASDAKIYTASAVFDEQGTAKGLFGRWSSFDRSTSAFCEYWHYDASNNLQKQLFLEFNTTNHPKLPDTFSTTINDCISNIPDLVDEMEMFELESNLTSGSAHVTIESRGISTLSDFRINVLYEKSEKIGRLFSSIKRHGSIEHPVNLIRGRNSLSITMERAATDRPVCPVQIPYIVNSKSDKCYFGSSTPTLNEFGSLYVSTYILGMLARYNPHIWMKYFSEKTEFALLCEQICAVAVKRIPSLFLEGISEVRYHIS